MAKYYTVNMALVIYCYCWLRWPFVDDICRRRPGGCHYHIVPSTRFRWIQTYNWSIYINFGRQIHFQKICGNTLRRDIEDIEGPAQGHAPWQNQPLRAFIRKPGSTGICSKIWATSRASHHSQQLSQFVMWRRMTTIQPGDQNKLPGSVGYADESSWTRRCIDDEDTPGYLWPGTLRILYAYNPSRFIGSGNRNHIQYLQHKTLLPDGWQRRWFHSCKWYRQFWFRKQLKALAQNAVLIILKRVRSCCCSLDAGKIQKHIARRHNS